MFYYFLKLNKMHNFFTSSNSAPNNLKQRPRNRLHPRKSTLTIDFEFALNKFQKCRSSALSIPQ